MTACSVVFLLFLMPATMAEAADLLVLGKAFTVRAGRQHTVVGLAREPASDVTRFSDPRTGGATLTVVANGATSTTQSYLLDAAGWAPIGSLGFKYAGPTGADGDPVKSVRMTRLPRGVARIAIAVKAGVGSQPVDVVPPDPGMDGGFILDVAGGDRYCVTFGGAAGGVTKRNDGTRWRIVDATAENGCPAPPAVCGNNVVEPPETCDGGATTPDCHQEPLTYNGCVDCQCCGVSEHRCSPQNTCCDARDTCAPAPGVLACVRTCTTSADCGGGGTTPAHCEGGLCCAALGEDCDNQRLGTHVRCCGGHTCGRGATGQFTCCIAAGQACSNGSDCCSFSCNATTSTCD